MSTFRYNIGDTYPDLKGRLSYAGPVKTDTMVLTLLADGGDTGPFAGVTTIIEFNTMQDKLSTIDWHYNVQETDTLVEGSYKSCLQVTHFDGSIETIPLGNIVVEVRCE